MSAGFDTEVRGEPGTLRDCARWLRGTVSGDLHDAASRQTGARRDAAGGWEGASCDAYRDVGAAAISATDDHAARVSRAADDVDGVADRLADLRRTMGEVRGDARSAGLVVRGDTILMPFPAVGLGGVQGVLPDGSDGDPSYAAKRAAYDRLERRARTARRDAEDWITDHLTGAGERAAERGDVDVLRRRLGGPAPSGDFPAAGPIEAPGGPVAPVTGAGGGGLAGAGSPTPTPSGPVGGGGVAGPEGGPGRGQDGGARVVPVEPPSRGRPRWVDQPGRGDRVERVEDSFERVEDAVEEAEDYFEAAEDYVEEAEDYVEEAEDAVERVVDDVETVPGGLPTAEPGEVPVAAPGVRRAC